jgi:uncharacterized protein
MPLSALRSLLTLRPTTFLACALAVSIVASCTSGPPPPVREESYEAQIAGFRQSKDEVFRNDAVNSPLPPSDRAAFQGLLYFPVDSRYHVPAALTEDRVNPPAVIVLPTSQNKPRRMTRVGTLRFTIAGTAMTLAAFAGEGEGLDRLFVPFWDATNRTETYGGGRYLELDRTPTGLYDLDFNRAYNPFCVYNVTFDCPIPPPENRLAMPIRAGERMRS